MRTLDPQSLTKHIDRLYPAAWALCGSREDAEDLVREPFARVFARPRVLSGDDEVYYLMRVLRNMFLTGRRTASRRPATAATLEDVITAREGRFKGYAAAPYELDRLRRRRLLSRCAQGALCRPSPAGHRGRFLAQRCLGGGHQDRPHAITPTQEESP